MTNLITDPDIIEKYVRVEWPHLTEEQHEWRCKGERGSNHPQSICYAIDNFASRRDAFVGNDDPEKYPEIMRQSLGFTIHGNGGLHRYYVRANGEICLSKRHSYADGRALAENQGFGMFD